MEELKKDDIIMTPKGEAVVVRVLKRKHGMTVRAVVKNSLILCAFRDDEVKKIGRSKFRR